MSRITRLAFGVIAAVIAVVAVLMLRAEADRPGTETPSADAPATLTNSALVRPNSHRLTDPADSRVTVVEFLDFECEACRDAFPAVERLRGEYGDRVTFVLRYFPIPSHINGELAARAVEAAAQQGKLVPMYQKMYETQAAWGEKTESQRAVFVGFATELGLDIARFEHDLDAPGTAERVRADRTDGMKSGVRGTPTFFVNGTKFSGAPSYEALKAAIDEELS
ncbi:oxidoreductase [Mycolicibacterium mageritense DSM 44476 = CIP 104973]|uniref:Thioredoxin domain-containing protein n=1 Tax=Mycolicibacterium mageritense TaxID=53462 RepID=A0ABM7HYG4_MYCME|nr:thioredoxin domain-containing protein [Mycolicibacterium mageritense]MCC9180379.1 DsbA family protein [Mycolicibacterium mageritense]BBX35647.1 hypothetical protein MMAGJ_49290 [Mycolicibacterium mageritense]CDO19847.1 DSBA oxidoreductase [Mycolicibacterium mageritense DSM 44476 = CIP 104973]